MSVWNTLLAVWNALIIEHRLPWRVQSHMICIPFIMHLYNKFHIPITVQDGCNNLGDTLLTALVAKNIKRIYPHIKINCITKFPELIKYDPNIDYINLSVNKTFGILTMEYDKLIKMKNPSINVLEPSLSRVGIKQFDYNMNFYLTEDELEFGAKKLCRFDRPIIVINTVGGRIDKINDNKNWLHEYWQELIRLLLKKKFTIVQLGADTEYFFDGVFSFAGKLSPRESVAVLSQANVFVGPVSFLMHAANGLNIPSVIIYGGRETPYNSGYKQNKNIYIKTECSPCFIKGKCPFNRKCMKAITPEVVYRALMELIYMHCSN